MGGSRLRGCQAVFAKSFPGSRDNPLLHLELRPCNIAPTPPPMSASPTSYVQRFIPLRMPRVCVAVTGSDPTELMDKAESLVRDSPFLEFRLDYLPRPGLALPKIKRFLEMFPHAAVIATCRRKASGGKFCGECGAPMKAKARCSECGKEFDNAPKFCDECGKKVG